MVFSPSDMACQNCVFKFRTVPVPCSNKVCFSHTVLKKMLLFPFSASFGLPSHTDIIMRCVFRCFPPYTFAYQRQQRSHIPFYSGIGCTILLYNIRRAFYIIPYSGRTRRKAFRPNTILSRVRLRNKNLQYLYFMRADFEGRPQWPTRKSDSMILVPVLYWFRYCCNTARWKMTVFIFQIVSDCFFQFPLSRILLTHHNKHAGPALIFTHSSQNIVNNLIINYTLGGPPSILNIFFFFNNAVIKNLIFGIFKYN